MRYFSIPIIAQFQLKHVGIELGFQPSHLVADQIKEGTSTFWSRNLFSYKPLEIGGILGINYSINKLTFGTRCYYALTPTNSQKYTDALNQPVRIIERTGVLQFYIAYALIGNFIK